MLKKLSVSFMRSMTNEKIEKRLQAKMYEAVNSIKD